MISVRCAVRWEWDVDVNLCLQVTGYAADKLDEALQGVEVVVIPAGVPRKPGMTRDDLFNTNASIVRDLAAVIARNAPKAHILVSPTPSTPPSPSLRAPSKKPGRTTPRASSASPPSTSSVRPASSSASRAPTPLKPPLPSLAGSEAWKAFVHRIQYGGDEVVQAKDEAGSVTLNMAYAAAKFTNLLLRALKGGAGIVTPTFVKSPLFVSQGIEFFSSAPNGVKKIHDLGNITAQAQELVNAALPELKKNIEKGFAFVQ
ncbi:hypothetical protein M422DRAFT_272708 [Sphaerobolus stellatus SS14]|uniref:malate dehydrogenase n=1 Tax=Sphaerobolus stellatus (strain SS14) TaxID=990650 RepID=A0A0C9TWP4_SPHS4|nr:hypothetical protein M422DRAFT_272708 [Sphaerobolus stellatus SS14]